VSLLLCCPLPPAYAVWVPAVYICKLQAYINEPLCGFNWPNIRTSCGSGTGSGWISWPSADAPPAPAGFASSTLGKRFE